MDRIFSRGNGDATRGCPWGIYGGDRVYVTNAFIGKRGTLWSMMHERLQKDTLRADNSISRVIDKHGRTTYIVGIYNYVVF
jgi:hypothetical protein